MSNINYETFSEEQVLELIAKNDIHAQNYLLEKYKNTVKIKARSFFLAGADQEDLIQEGMIGLYSAVCDYSPDMGASFSTFAELCINRRIITAIKSANRRKHSPLNGYLSFDVAEGDVDHHLFLRAAGQSPEDIIIAREEKDYIEHKLLQGLSRFEKAVLSNYLQGKSYTETARLTGKNEKAVDNGLQRVRKKLMKILNEKNLTNEKKHARIL